MSHDPFENELAALARRELPAEWRTQILTAASTSATAHLARPPRWLMAGWVAAWAATLVLYFGTLPTPEPPSPSAERPPAPGMPALRWEQRLAQMQDLLATK